MYKVEHLEKSFDSETVLGPVSTTFTTGKTTVIVGPSGSGKSTFLRCLNGLETPTAGTVFHNDVMVNEKTLMTLRPKVGMVFQNFNLFAHMTVEDNVMYALKVIKKLPPEERRRIAHAVLERVGLLDKINAYPRTLSGGQKQRVAIARTLAMSPDVFLFDEPTSALDPEMVGEVLDVIKDITQQGFTSIIVTHEMGFAREVGDEILFMHQGIIKEKRNAKEFFSNPQTQEAQTFLKKIL